MKDTDLIQIARVQGNKSSRQQAQARMRAIRDAMNPTQPLRRHARVKSALLWTRLGPYAGTNAWKWAGAMRKRASTARLTQRGWTRKGIEAAGAAIVADFAK